MPRFAAIDVGSNALRLRVVEAEAPSQAGTPRLAQIKSRGPWRDLATQRAPVRLGAEVFLSGRLTPTSIGQACGALREFRQEMDRWKVDAYRAIATSAVREAKNGGTLVERARREAAIELETIEGIEEARLITLAVTRRIEIGDRRVLLADVGGGSTEL
ncbi:MAG: Ppx/GppA phosphatase family protein, partial [Polyangiaceae bacterium]